MLRPTSANLNFWPSFITPQFVHRDMEERLKSELEKAGDELRASHDDAVIADVIGAVEELDNDSASQTAEILRFMVSGE